MLEINDKNRAALIKAMCLGVSACLLGHRTRYDGGHRFQAGLAGLSAIGVRFKALCPEVEAGLGCPRPPAYLAGSLIAPRLVIAHSGQEAGPAVEAALKRREAQGLWAEVDGFILKARSPSCAPDFYSAGHPGPGLLALALRRSRPDLPLADESVLTGRLEPFLEQCLLKTQARLNSKRPLEF